MENVFLTIRDALVKLFKGLFPAFDVISEEIAKTDGHGKRDEDIENYVFLSLTPTGNETLGPYLTARRVLVDAAVHTRKEDNNGYWQMAGQIDSSLRPAFAFGGRAITVPDVQYAIVDRVLHCVFTLSFMDGEEELSTLPVTGELVFNMRKE